MSERMTNEEYVEHYGQMCPFCSSKNVSTDGELEADCEVAWQNVVCNDCDKEWTDYFKLVGYDYQEE